MTTHVVLIHGGKSTIAKLREALPGSTATLVMMNGLSSKYDERMGVAHDYPSFEGFMQAFVPSWVPGEPLVIYAYSAGSWALRYYLREARARQLISAAIFLDGLYGSADGSSLETTYAGVVEFARMAQADPKHHRLVMTYHGIGPGNESPGIYSEAIAKAVGGGAGPGVFVRPYLGTTHAEQQSFAPAIARELIAPWIGSSATGGSVFAWLVVAPLAFAVGFLAARRYRGAA